MSGVQAPLLKAQVEHSPRLRFSVLALRSGTKKQGPSILVRFGASTVGGVWDGRGDAWAAALRSSSATKFLNPDRSATRAACLSATTFVRFAFICLHSFAHMAYIHR